MYIYIYIYIDICINMNIYMYKHTCIYICTYIERERERERERDGVCSAISPFLGGLLESWHYYPSHGIHIDVSFDSLSWHTYRCICQDPEKVRDRVTMFVCA